MTNNTPPVAEQVKVEQSDRDAAVLKPCPFCGSTDVKLFPATEDTDAIVQCRNGNCRITPYADESLDEQAIAAWNTRPAEQQIVADMAAIPHEPSINIVARQQSPVVADYEDNFLVARVNKDGSQISIDHPYDAVWTDVMTVHVALRDYINERIERQDSCPFKAKAAALTLPENEEN